MFAFFTLAARSRTRQRTFRTLLIAHGLALALFFVAMARRSVGPVALGQFALIAGIIEGSLLIGWRLTQLPKSQSLEFLLVSPLRPPIVFIAEAAVGATLVALVTISGLPIYVAMLTNGLILLEDLPILFFLPWVWGLATGSALAVWAYEPLRVRWWGEKIAILGIIVYLFVGVLAAERLVDWLRVFPSAWGSEVLRGLRLLHDYNPFGTMHFAMQADPAWVWRRASWNALLGLALVTCLLWRGAFRLHPHFHDEPLTWWAVKRVSRYAGRINVYLAGGFGFAYAAYCLAGPNWPDWLGRTVFQMFDRAGGLPMLATAMLLLAAVPAAFQYGLWDSGGQDRSRRLELLLLTQLDGIAYWRASISAAWDRGREYFFLAIVMTLAGVGAGQISVLQALAGLSAGAVLWSFYFTLGFRAFSRGQEANRLGAILTLILPLATYLLAQTRWVGLAGVLPPGSVFFGISGSSDLPWAAGLLAVGLATLILTRIALRDCDANLRGWYQQNHGLRAAE